MTYLEYNDVLCDAFYLLAYHIDFLSSNNKIIQSMNLNNYDTSEICTKQSKPKKNLNQIKPWLYRPKKNKFGNRRTYKYNDQHWNMEENAKYLEFLILYMELFQADINKKRKYHLNRMASKFIGTRSPIQCRSHHQRMLKAYGTLQNIVRGMKSQVKKETVQIQKPSRTYEVVEISQKSQESKFLQDFELQSSAEKTKDQNVQMQMKVDSFEQIFNQYFDL